MSVFLNRQLAGLIPYTPGEQPKRGEFIKLNTNESPYPPSPRAVAAAAEAAKTLNLYCDPSAKALTAEFCNYYNVDNVIFGNGSDEILAFCYLAFCEKEVAFPKISYGFYQVFSDLYNVVAEQIPLTENFEIDPATYFNKKKTIIIANPNAPTGIALNKDQLESILAANEQNVVIIDEAYADFSGFSARSLIEKYNNLVVVGTFSKSRNLAGARLGFAVANTELINDIALVKNSYNPYNVNAVTQAMGAVSIAEAEYFEKCVGKIVAEREKFTEFLEQNGFYTLPSKANFVFTKPAAASGEELYEYLRSKKILVRYFKAIPDFVRITIGTAIEMDAVKEAIIDWRK